MAERRRRATRARQYRTPQYRELLRRIADNIRRLRKDREWSQEEASFRSEMPTRLLQGAEAGEMNLTLATLARLCVGFGVDIEDLVRHPAERPRAGGLEAKSPALRPPPRSRR